MADATVQGGSRPALAILTLTAPEVVAILTGPPTGSGGVDLTGVRCDERVVLDDLVVAHALRLADCTLAGLALRRTTLPCLEVEDCALGAGTGDAALDATGAVVHHTLHLAGCRLQGPLRVQGARLGGLAVEGSTIRTARRRCSLDARQVRVRSSILLRGPDLHLSGPVDAAAARVQGDVRIIKGAHVGASADDGINRWSLRLNSATVRGELEVDGADTHCAGGLQLIGASIGAQLRISGGCRLGPDDGGQSIVADGLTAGNDVFLMGRGTYLGGAVRVHSARIAGQLGIDAIAAVGADHTGTSVIATGAVIEQSLVVRGPTHPGETRTRLLGAIHLDDAELRASIRLAPGVIVGTNDFGNSVFADRARITGDLRLESSWQARSTGPRPITRLLGALRLADARVGGTLAVRDHTRIGTDDRRARERGEADGDSLVADGLTVGRDLVLGTATLDGGIALAGVCVGGDLRIEAGASVGANRPYGASLYLDATEVQGSLRVRGPADLAGGVVGRRVRVTGTVEVEGGVRIGRHGQVSLSLPDLTAREVLVSTPAVEGPIGLSGATVGDVTISAEPNRPRRKGQHLDLSGAHLGTLTLPHATTVDLVDLRSAEIAVLEDAPDFWGLPKPRHRRGRVGPGVAPVDRCLGGLTVGRATADDGFPLRTRFRWLRHTRPAPEQETVDPADRVAYRGVARALASAGLDRDARRTLAQMEWRHRRGWRWLTAPIGQGYYTGRAALHLGVLLVATFLLVASWGDAGHFVAPATERPTTSAPAPAPKRSDDCDASDVACFEPVSYTLETLIPGLGLNEGSRWRPEPSEDLWTPENRRRWVLVGLRALGLVLGFLVVYGIVNQTLERRRVS